MWYRGKDTFEKSWKRRLLEDTNIAPTAGSGSGDGQPGPAKSTERPIASVPASAVPPTKTDEKTYGSFKTADELHKGYTSLQSEFTKTSQALKDMQAWKADVETKLRGNGSTDFDVKKFWERMAEDPRGPLMELLQPQLEAIQRAQLTTQITATLDGLRKRYPDFHEFEPKMDEYVKSGAFNAMDARSLETLYLGLKKAKEGSAAGAGRPVPGVETPGAGSDGMRSVTEGDAKNMKFEDLEKIVKALPKQ